MFNFGSFLFSHRRPCKSERSRPELFNVPFFSISSSNKILFPTNIWVEYEHRRRSSQERASPSLVFKVRDLIYAYPPRPVPAARCLLAVSRCASFSPQSFSLFSVDNLRSWAVSFRGCCFLIYRSTLSSNLTQKEGRRQTRRAPWAAPSASAALMQLLELQGESTSFSAHSNRLSAFILLNKRPVGVWNECTLEFEIQMNIVKFAYD